MTGFANRPEAWGDDDVDGAAAWAAGLEVYHASLADNDLTGAGDLLTYFGYDFFHDADILLDLGHRKAAVELKLTAWIDTREDSVFVPFTVEFRGLDWFAVDVASPDRGLGTFGYAEIDGLGDRIAAAIAAHGGEYHSLVIQCAGGWMSFVFRSVRVAAVDSALWMNVVRNPSARVFIWGLDDLGSSG